MGSWAQTVVQTLTAGAPALFRLGTAAFVSDNLKNFRKRPQKPIELYEFEGCPFCRKASAAAVFQAESLCSLFVSFCMLHLQVREACTLLDIDVKFYPCPKGGPTWRPKVPIPAFYISYTCMLQDCTMMAAKLKKVLNLQ